MCPVIEQSPAMTTPDPDFMTSLARGLQVIRAFTEHRRLLTMSQVSQATGLSRAAAGRCLHTLGRLGYVGVEGRRYFLRPQVLALGHAYLVSTPLTARAQPVLDRVSAQLHESCSMAMLEGEDIVYVGRSAETRILSITLMVGSRLPAYCTAMGQVLLAALDDPALDAFLATAKLVARTPRTTVSADKLRKRLQAVRRTGHALLDQELEAGVRSIAVPVVDAGGRVVAAINASGHADRVETRTLRERFLPVLHDAAAELAGTLA
jgi:IclR family pca regulon transcriptional regulator